jgi:pimeloyl-ACP methyl ester carboxylesterase
MDDSQYLANHPPKIREIVMANTVQLKGGMLYPKSGFPDISCNDLRNIRTPVLLVTGEKSLLYFTSIINELERCLPNREKVILRNASHGLEYENPVEFNKMVLGFIDKH